MRNVEFHPEAQAELIAAAGFFESKAPHLGADFIDLVQNATLRLLQFPNSGRRVGRRLRRLLVPRFLYSVLYRVEPDRLYIVAVAHPSRRPRYWRQRV